MKPIIFTDLDGTLLDAATYSFEKAMPALSLILEMDIPLICCSSKTKKEIELYRTLLANHHPFITENGGGIFIPEGYFSPVVMPLEIPVTKEGGYLVMRLGTGYETLRQALRELREDGFAVNGFGDMTADEVAEITGLSVEEAAMAKKRDSDEPFLFDGPDDEVELLVKAVENKGFFVTQGKYFHILGNNDKGKAVAILTEMFEKKFGQVITVGVGDSPNDLPMLQRVDHPLLVMKPDGRHDPRIRIEGLMMVNGIGPEGWNIAVLNLLRRLPHGG